MDYRKSRIDYNRAMENIELTQPILQYPTDLVFAVMAEDVSSQLTTLKTTELVIGDYHIRFTIIGESHCITVMHDDQLILQEVLACTEIPQILQAQSHKFAKLEPYCFKQMGYRSQVWFANTLAMSDWQPQEQLRLDFPDMFGQTPFTSIVWLTNQQAIRWRTTHVYPLPTHTTYVYSETVFDLTERSNND